MSRDFHHLLIDRRSTRSFRTGKISPENTALILQAALLAPTSKNSHSCQFIAIDDKKTLQKLAVAKPNGATLISGAAFVVVVVGDPLLSDVWIEDASIASFAMQMQAEDLNIGSCWVQMRNREFSETQSAGEYICELLDIPMPLQVLSVVAFGERNTKGRATDVDKLLWEKVHIDKFNRQ